MRSPTACAPASRAPATARSTRRRSSTTTCCAAATCAPPAPPTGCSASTARCSRCARTRRSRSRAWSPRATRTTSRRSASATSPTPTATSSAGSGEPREFLQGGIELIGVEAPAGEAEVLALTIAALDDAGLRRHRVGVGDASLYRSLLAELEVPEEEHLPLLEALARRDLVGSAPARRAPGSARAPAGAADAPARAARRPRGARPRRRPGGRGRREPARRCTSCWPSAGSPTG